MTGMQSAKKMKRVVWAGILGNTLELYDYTIYAYFASILAVQFFPSDDPLAGLLAAYGVYASGFLLRPLGAVLLGSIGDRYGRKRALEISILLIALPTFCMGLLPNYSQAGILAPILLTAMRMLQGLSVGGEVSSAYAFLVEHASENEKGYAGTWCLVGNFSGKWFGSLVAMSMTLLFAPAALNNWGWRIPFLLGIIFALAGYWIRRLVSETPAFQEMQKSRQITKSPLKETIKSCGPTIFLCFCWMAAHTTVLQMIFIYFPTYFKSILGFDHTYSLLSNLAALTIAMVVMPLSGKLSDRIGRRPIMLSGAVLLTLLAYPAFVIIAQGQPQTAIAVHLLMAAIYGWMHGPMPATIMELFPANVRCTGSAIAYNLSVGLFGGLTPIISTWLISCLSCPEAPALWIIICGTLSAIATCRIKELTTDQLRSAA